MALNYKKKKKVFIIVANLIIMSGQDYQVDNLTEKKKIGRKMN